MSPSSPASQSSQYILPPQQMEDCYTAPAPQGAGAFPHYNGSEEFQYCSEHGGRAMNPDLVNTFRAGIYAYGQNNELETRSEEELAALNHSFIQANDAMTPSRDPVFEPMDDLITDGTIDPSKLSLPLLKEKVPCPECGILLKDEKSVRYVTMLIRVKSTALSELQSPSLPQAQPERGILRLPGVRLYIPHPKEGGSAPPCSL